LRTDIAKPLSLHLAYRFFKNSGSTWTVDYEWLSQRLAIKVHSDLKRAKDQLKPALVELTNTGLIDSWEWLDSQKIRFEAGERLLQMHKQRVMARDAWIIHEEEKSRTERLITTHPPRTVKEAVRQEAFDPLAALCAEFAVRGWTAVAKKATGRGLSRDMLKEEALKRGHSLGNCDI
jgi:hypothetical protein